MPGGKVLPSTRPRLLPDPGVRTVVVGRDSVVGLVLDQHGVVAGQGLHRSVDRAHNIDHERCSQGHSAPGLLRQGTTREAYRLRHFTYFRLFLSVLLIPITVDLSLFSVVNHSLT